MKKILAFLAVGLVFSFGAHAATISVSGGTGLQAAIDGAANNDVIEITDSATYTEDIHVPAAKTGLTIRAAAGQTPQIVAANSASGRGLLGVVNAVAGAGGLPDGAGMFIEGDGTTLIGLQVNNPGTGVNPVFTSANAIFITADNVTIQNCHFTGMGDTTVDDACFVVGTGRWDLLGNAAGAPPLAAFGETNANDLLVEDTTISDCNIAVAIIDLAHAIRAALFSQLQTVAFQNASAWNRVVIRDSDDFSASTNTLGAVWTDCHFTNGLDSFGIEGGNWVFENCVWDNLGANQEFIEISIDVTFGGGLSTVAVSDSILCGGFPGGTDRLIEIENAQMLISNTIISVTEPTMPAIYFEPYAIPGAYNTFGIPINFDRSLTVLNCDIYNPGGPGISGPGGEWGPNILNPAHITVTDTIIVAGTGIEVPSTNPVAGSSVNVTFSNIQAAVEIGTVAAGWDLTNENNLNVAPGYVNPGGCDKSDYEYTNVALATASSVGGGIGSQTPPGPQPAGVEKWEVYE